MRARKTPLQYFLMVFVMACAAFTAGESLSSAYPLGSPDMPGLSPGTYILRKMSVTPETAQPQPIQPCDVLTSVTVNIVAGVYQVSLLDSYAGTCGGAPALSPYPRNYSLVRDTRFPFPCGVAYVSYQQVDTQSGEFPEFTLKDYRYAPEACRQTDSSGRPGVSALMVANEWSPGGMTEWGAYP